MAQLLYSSYTPRETFVCRWDSHSAKDFLGLKYEFKELTGNYYQFIKPPTLEMVFQEGERDFVFPNMLDEVHKYRYSRKRENEDEIQDITVENFVALIASGEIKVIILPDGSYTLK